MSQGHPTEPPPPPPTDTPTLQADSITPEQTAEPEVTAEEYKDSGNAHYEQGEYEQAIADYTRAIALDPDYTIAYSNRGAAHYEEGAYDQAGDPERAIADLDQATALDPGNAGAYLHRGLAYAAAGNPEQAMLDFSQVIELEPNYAGAYFNRALVFVNTGVGDREQTIQDLERYLEFAPNASNRDVVLRSIEELKAQSTD